MGGLIRLTHPFPCLLDGLVVAAVSLLAGADTAVAVRIGVSMTALQASIGTLNDLVDAPRDAGRKPGKPIPAGVVSPGLGRLVVVAAGVVGLALAVASGGPLLVLGLIVLGIGYGYDTWFKGTAWSWLPFAVGIPLLPVFGWLGAAGGLPPGFAILVPAAVAGGAALAIANARADMERDAAAGINSVALRLGPARSWTIHAALLGGVIVAAIITLAAAGGVSPAAVLAAAGAAVLIAVGVVIGRTGDRVQRERAWELEAVGLGVLAVAWLAGIRLGG